MMAKKKRWYFKEMSRTAGDTETGTPGSDCDVLHSSPSARCVPPADSFTSASYAEKVDRLPTVWHTQTPPQTSQHHMTFKQDLWCPHPSNHHHQPSPPPHPPPSIKSTFLFLHFTAMPIVNPARPGKAPSSFFFLFCNVQWKPLISV